VSLEAELAEVIRHTGDDDAFPFEAWAARVFAHQFAHNAPYRAFCERRGVTPSSVASWEDVPPVPTAAFRHADLTTGPPEAVFRTSGTSGGAEARGRHLVPHLDLYRASAMAAFERFLLPDGARLPALFLLPPPSERPDSSLVRMCEWVGAEDMPRPLSRPGFLRACWTRLGVAGYFCVNEYGMTELCSQLYESVLRDRFAGRSLAPRRLVAPPWLRTRVLDPDTLAPVPPGTVGLLCHHDLANAGSVYVVLTEDLGRTVGDDGIAVVGRVPGATPRGCGLLLADLVP